MRRSKVHKNKETSREAAKLMPLHEWKLQRPGPDNHYSQRGVKWMMFSDGLTGKF